MNKSEVISQWKLGKHRIPDVPVFEQEIADALDIPVETVDIYRQLDVGIGRTDIITVELTTITEQEVINEVKRIMLERQING